MKKIILLSAAVFLIDFNMFAQTVKAACVAFYNFENLFDTEDDTLINDEEYLPNGKNEWNEAKYQKKLENLSVVISQIGDTEDGKIVWNGPTFLGGCEIENRRVLEDLINTPKLKDKNYGIIHYDSPDGRGVDVGFLYKKDYFKPYNHKAYKLTDPEEPKRRTRDQLLVSGVFDGDTFHFIVNHWPSRAATGDKRVNAAKLCRNIVDSILNIQPKAKIFVMGDFNDTPVDKSLNYLVHKSEKRKPEDENVVQLFNPMMEMHKQGFGTIAHDDVWTVFDMIIISPALLDETNGYHYKLADKWDRNFLHRQDGKFKGYPLRTHAGGVYLAGYSDHLPVYMYVIKKK